MPDQAAILRSSMLTPFTPNLYASQRPILLSGHERSLNQIKYNREGDLLFSVSKDNVVCAWFSHNGERLGTYEGHNGTVWSVDVDGESG